MDAICSLSRYSVAMLSNKYVELADGTWVPRVFDPPIQNELSEEHTRDQVLYGLDLIGRATALLSTGTEFDLEFTNTGEIMANNTVVALKPVTQAIEDRQAQLYGAVKAAAMAEGKTEQEASDLAYAQAERFGRKIESE
jgi:hypothetical protein